MATKATHVARSRMLDLMRLQCQIFSRTYNPENKRLGNDVLRQRLKGPNIRNYYPTFRTAGTMEKLMKAYPKEWEWEDEDKLRAEDDLEALKARGKGAPKKKKTKTVGKRK